MRPYELLLFQKRDEKTWRCRLEWGGYRVYGEGDTELLAVIAAMKAAQLFSDRLHFTSIPILDEMEELENG